jgi:chromosome segregation ATPase
MNTTYEKAVELVEKYNIPNRHTFYQLKYFIIGKEPTIQAKLQKCLKEIDARKDSIKNMLLSIDEAQDDIDLINLKIEELNKKNIKCELKKQYKKIQIKKFNRKKENLQESVKSIKKKLQDAEQETQFFLSAFEELQKIEDLKPYDDIKSNIEFWNENFSQELKLRILLQKPLDLELVKCILALNNDAPIKKEILNIIENTRVQALKQAELKLEDNLNG